MRSDVSDNELWAGIKNENEGALTQLFQRYYFYLIKAGFAYTQDVELAKDAVNDVFYNLWRNRRSLSEVDNVKAYLNAGFRNQVLALLRRNVKNRERVERWGEEQPGAQLSYEEVVIAAQREEEQKEKVRKALAALTPRQKEFLRLKYYEGLSYEQIAEKSGQAVKTIYNTVYEAIKALRTAPLKK